VGNSKRKIEVTYEQLGEILLGLTLPISKDPTEEVLLEGFDVSDMSEREKLKLNDEIFMLRMFAITYACQQEITTSEMSKHIIDSYHEHVYDWMKHNGTPEEAITSFSECLQERYKAYYSALRKGLEAHKSELKLWYIGKTAAKYALGESEDPLWTTQFVINLVSTVEAARNLIGEYKILNYG